MQQEFFADEIYIALKERYEKELNAKEKDIFNNIKESEEAQFFITNILRCLPDKYSLEFRILLTIYLLKERKRILKKETKEKFEAFLYPYLIEEKKLLEEQNK